MNNDSEYISKYIGHNFPHCGITIDEENLMPEVKHTQGPNELLCIDNHYAAYVAHGPRYAKKSIGEDRAILYTVPNEYENLLKENYKEIIKNVFSNLNKKIKNKDHADGSTLTLAVRVGNQLYIGTLGDSGAFLIQKNKEKYTVRQLNTFQQCGPNVPDLAGKTIIGTIEDFRMSSENYNKMSKKEKKDSLQERPIIVDDTFYYFDPTTQKSACCQLKKTENQRTIRSIFHNELASTEPVTQYGNKTIPLSGESANRLGGQLQLYGALGDFHLHECGLMTEPRVICIELTSQDLYVLLGSDGICLWDYAQTIQDFLNALDVAVSPSSIAQHLFLKRNNPDDYSCVVIELFKGKNQKLVLCGIADGHGGCETSDLIKNELYGIFQKVCKDWYRKTKEHEQNNTSDSGKQSNFEEKKYEPKESDRDNRESKTEQLNRKPKTEPINDDSKMEKLNETITQLREEIEELENLQFKYRTERSKYKDLYQESEAQYSALHNAHTQSLEEQTELENRIESLKTKQEKYRKKITEKKETIAGLGEQMLSLKEQYVAQKKKYQSLETKYNQKVDLELDLRQQNSSLSNDRDSLISDLNQQKTLVSQQTTEITQFKSNLDASQHAYAITQNKLQLQSTALDVVLKKFFVSQWVDLSTSLLMQEETLFVITKYYLDNSFYSDTIPKKKPITQFAKHVLESKDFIEHYQNDTYDAFCDFLNHVFSQIVQNSLCYDTILTCQSEKMDSDTESKKPKTALGGLGAFFSSSKKDKKVIPKNELEEYTAFLEMKKKEHVCSFDSKRLEEYKSNQSIPKK